MCAQAAERSSHQRRSPDEGGGLSQRGRAAGSDSGSALVELALCLPLLVLTMVGVTDFARVFYTSIELNNAARAGAQYGAYTLARSGDTLGMQTTATGAVNITGVTIEAPLPICQCADNAGNFSPLAGGSTCATDVATSCPLKHRVVTVTVRAKKKFTPVVNYAGIFHPVDLTRTATLRVSE